MSSHQSTPGQRAAPFDTLELDSFLDFDNSLYCGTSVSPLERQPSSSRMPVATGSNNTLLPPRQQMEAALPSGPSFAYDSFPQQTGLPTGFMNTLGAAPIADGFNAGFDMPVGFSFNAGRNNSVFSAASEFDFDANSPNADHNIDELLFTQRSLSNSSNGQYVNPSMMTAESVKSEGPSPTSTQSNVGRLYPGMHSQQAALRAQQQAAQAQQVQHQRSPSDPAVDDKINQLLSSVHHQSVAAVPKMDGSNMSLARMKKDEDDMDEDERLLASEEGKKLSSKERRQLRNKVSARAFRSRRKEYIGQLEAEVAAKNNEVSDLRMHNTALAEENARLSDLTRMLLSSPAFSGFLEDLSLNSEPVPAQLTRQVQQMPQQQQQQMRPPMAPVQRQMPKDMPSHNVRPQVNMALIPENSAVDFGTLDLNAAFDMSNAAASWNQNQPQVFAVLELPQGPAVDQLDMEAISGKSSSPAPLFEECEKATFPVLSTFPSARPTVETAVTDAVESVTAELIEEVTPQAEARLNKICGAADATRRRLEEMLL